jgi:hypothetical protein
MMLVKVLLLVAAVSADNRLKTANGDWENCDNWTVGCPASSVTYNAVIDKAIVFDTSDPNGHSEGTEITIEGPDGMLTIDCDDCVFIIGDSDTHSPTNSPTDAPTDFPTDSPTDAPTGAPTGAPTDAPTKAPTVRTIDQDLIGHWTYDDGTCNDNAGRQSTTMQNSPSFTTVKNNRGLESTNRPGKALTVTGGNGCIVNSLANHVWGRKFTACTWFKRAANDGAYRGIVSTGYHDNGSWEFRLGREGGGTQGGGGIMNSLAWKWFLPPNTFPVAKWSHVCMTYDADAGSNAGHMYVNGVDTGIVGASFGDMKTTANAMYIGTGTGREDFSGQIDETRIYSAALTPALIMEIYDSELIETPPAPPIDVGLIGHWTYDDGTCNDSAGRQSTTMQNSPSFTTGTRGQALSVNGANGCTVNSLANHVWGRKFTACTWFKRAANDGAYRGIVSTGYYTNGSWEFRLGREGGGTQGGGGIMNSLAWKWWLPANTFPVAKWNHVCMTYDADAGSNAGHYYVNGVDTGIVGASFGDMKTTANAMYIGAGTGTEDFSGQIDETRIYNVALTPALITQIYDTESA